MAQTEKILIELDFNSKDAEKNLVKLQANLDGTKNEIKSLETARKKGIVTAKSANEQRALLNIELKKNSKALGNQQKELLNINTANKATKGSNDQLKAQLSLLTAEYNSLSKEERENTKVGKEKKAQISQITEELKGNEEAVGNNRRSVGDYGKALDGTPFGGFISGIKSTGAALIANPIGLILTAIVGALALLKKAFLSSEEGQNKFAKGMAILGSLFDNFTDVIAGVADTLVDMFTSPKEALASFANAIKTNIINRFEGMLELIPQLGKAIGQLFSGNFAEAGKTAANAVGKVALGVEDIVGKVQAAGEAISDFTDEAIADGNRAAVIADKRAAADKLARQLLIDTAKAQAEVAEARRKSQDIENTTAQERLDALNRAAEITDNLAKKEERVAALRLSALKTENSLSNSNKEAKEAEAQAEAELINIQTRRANIQKGLLTDQKRVNAQILAEKQIVVEESISAAQAELDIIVAANRTKIEEGKFLNDQLFAQEQERLEAQKQAQITFEAEKLAATQEAFGRESEQAVAAQKEYNAAVNAVNEENELLNEELKIAKKEAEDEQALVDYETQREIEILRGEDKFEREKSDLERSRLAEVANAEKNGADTKKINEKYALLDKKIDKAKFDNKLQIASQTFGNLAALAGRESAAGKALAIAQTTIDTYKGATAAFSGMVSAIPGPVGIAAGVVAAAVAVASGVANVRKIASTQTPKAAKGGIFGGNLHSGGGNVGVFEDGTRVEVERDEAFVVINRNSTAMMNRLSDINVAGGGVSFADGSESSYMADGGVGIRAVTSTVDAEQNNTTQVLEAIQAQPAPVVVVQDINEVQGETIEVNQRATI